MIHDHDHDHHHHDHDHHHHDHDHHHHDHDDRTTKIVSAIIVTLLILGFVAWKYGLF